jgi:hypothetical protein
LIGHDLSVIEFDDSIPHFIKPIVVTDYEHGFAARLEFREEFIIKDLFE